MQMLHLPEVLSRIPLSPGKHYENAAQKCVMECVAFVMGEPHTDHPRCACPVVTRIAMHVNDGFVPNDGGDLSRRILQLAGSNRGEAVTRERAYFLTDYAFRTLVPRVVREVLQEPPGGYGDIANLFAALPAIQPGADMADIWKKFDDIPGAGALQPRAPICQYLGSMLRELEREKFVDVAHAFCLLDDAVWNSTDPIPLLDQLLAIGAAAEEIPVTEEMHSRIVELAETLQ